MNSTGYQQEYKPPSNAAMEILSLDLSFFRNHMQFNYINHASPIIICGSNGAGKTSILEAISLLTPGKGLRNANLDEMRNHNSTNGWTIEAEIKGENNIDKIKVEYYAGKTSRGIFINERKIKTHADLTSIFSVLWLTPQMDQLFIGPSANRRKFLDRIVYNINDIHHADNINIYDKATHERLQILKQISYDPLWIQALEHKMVEVGIKIIESRQATLNILQNAINASDTSFPKAKLFIEGELEKYALEVDKEELFAYYMTQLVKSRDLDAKLGRTNVGVHRSDLVVYHASKNIKASLCSTGEQKAMLLAIILGEARSRVITRSSVQVMLLDEVIAHLDENRRDELFDEIIKLGAQAWLTGTETKTFGKLIDMAQIITL
jgi:DNA replication and repair protein RecF